MSLADHLDILQDAGLLLKAQETADHAYLFRHALIQDAAYHSLLRQDRRRLHQFVGETLEALFGTLSSEFASVLAYHFHAADNQTQALRYYMMAGDLALEAYATEEAAHHYRQALTMAPPIETKALLLFKLGEALAQRAIHVRASEAWRQAIELYRQLEQPEPQGRIYARLARTLWEDGRADESLDICREGLEALRETPPNPGLADLFHEAARTHYFVGQMEEALRLAQEALTMARMIGDIQTEAQVYITLGLMPTQTVQASMEALRRGAELAESTNMFFVAQRGNVNLGETLAFRAGRLRDGLRHAERALTLSRQINNAGWMRYNTNVVAWISTWLGNYAPIEGVLPRAERARTGLIFPSTSVLLLAEAHYVRQQGDELGALALASILADRQREQQDLQFLTFSNSLIGEIRLDRDEPDQAEIPLLEAHSLTGRGSWAGRTWTAALLSIVYARLGQLEAAQHWLTQAQPDEEPGPLDRAYLAWAEAELALAEGDPARASAAFAAAIAAEGEAERPWHQTAMERRVARRL